MLPPIEVRRSSRAVQGRHSLQYEVVDVAPIKAGGGFFYSVNRQTALVSNRNRVQRRDLRRAAPGFTNFAHVARRGAAFVAASVVEPVPVAVCGLSAPAAC
jgi:hypothetical protein